MAGVRDAHPSAAAVNDFDPSDDDDDAAIDGFSADDPDRDPVGTSSDQRRARAVEELVQTEIVPNGDRDSGAVAIDDYTHYNGLAADASDESPDETVGVEELSDRTIGDFRILRRLGQGGMAEVYLAEQISLNRKVALKVLRTEVLSGRDDILVRRFRQEAKAAAALTHQNIVQVYGVGDEEGLHFIAQEYVHGLNLKQYTSRQGPPDAALALRFAKQIALALRAAAEAGIVHRDVKPENVMITPQGMVKVADFGLAQLSRDENVQLTQVGMTMGTPLYMSPEQVHGRTTDARSDLYSFGVTLWHVLAGEPPFNGETALAIAVKHLNEHPPRLHDRRGDLPRSLCDLVHRMMAKSPGDRPADAGEVFEELKRIGNAVTEGAKGAEIERRDRPASETRGWWEKRHRRSLLRHVAMFAVACAGMLLLAAFVGWVTRPGNPLKAPVVAPPIDRQPTVEEQLWVAENLYTEQSWQAVVDHFGGDPNARRPVGRARMRLGLMALYDRRYEEAERRFVEVNTRLDGDPELKLESWAGLSVAKGFMGDHSASEQMFKEHVARNFDLLPREMRLLVAETMRRNSKALNQTMDAQLEELFRSDEQSFEEGTIIPSADQ